MRQAGQIYDGNTKAGAGPGFFLGGRGGAPLRNCVTDWWRKLKFYYGISVVLESRGSSHGVWAGGGCAPPAPTPLIRPRKVLRFWFFLQTIGRIYFKLIMKPIWRRKWITLLLNKQVNWLMVGFHIKLIYFCVHDFQLGTCSKQQSDRSVGEGVRWQWQSRGTRLCCFSNKRRNSTPPNKSFRLNNIFGARNESTASRSLLFFVFQSEENCSVVSNLKEVMTVFC